MSWILKPDSGVAVTITTFKELQIKEAFYRAMEINYSVTHKNTIKHVKFTTNDKAL
ncbi:hypothetical protein T190115A13A_60205 [Tenacibaculum sp. 190524A02b]|uniref:Uncharacterized protein n=1 Tax=Tenacibaculum vairaonense TaxID=3137860 RepID=A0ABP1FCW6_9FLAO